MDWRNSVEYRWYKSGHIRGDAMKPFHRSGMAAGGCVGPQNSLVRSLMAQKGCFWPFWTSLEALWHTHIALPVSTLVPNRSASLERPDPLMDEKSRFGRFGSFWGPSGTPIWPSLTRKTVPIHHWGCAVTCSTLVSLCSTSLEPPDPLMAEKGRFWLFWTLFGSPLAHPYGPP